jgi:hypothetical protein
MFDLGEEQLSHLNSYISVPTAAWTLLYVPLCLSFTAINPRLRPSKNVRSPFNYRLSASQLIASSDRSINKWIGMDMAGNDRTWREDGVGLLSTHLPTVLERKRLWQRSIIVIVGWFAVRTCENPNKRYTNRLNYWVIFGVCVRACVYTHTHIHTIHKCGREPQVGNPLIKKLHRTTKLWDLKPNTKTKTFRNTV